MPKLKTLSGREDVKILFRFGFKVLPERKPHKIEKDFIRRDKKL